MKFLVLSDTHGRIEAAEQVFHCLKDVDQIIHLGDLEGDAKRLASDLSVEVVWVRGNMDGAFSKEDYRILNTEWGEILLVHGHMDGVKTGLLGLKYRAQELGCRGAFFGHTHVPLWVEEDGMFFLNPGSISLPRGGSQGSYAIVHTSKERLEASVLYLR